MLGPFLALCILHCVNLDMAWIVAVAVAVLLACFLPWVTSQLCDDNPLANNAMKVSLEASSSCLKGRTPDMTEVGTCQEKSAHNIRLPFAFKFLDRTYSGNGSGSVFVSSNSYVTFGGSSAAFDGFGPRVPSLPTLFIGSRYNALRNLSVGPDALGWRVRYEGWTLPNLVTTHKCSLNSPSTIVWELIFLFNNTLELCTGSVMENITGVSAVSDGVSGSFVQKFILTPSTLYKIATGLSLCECDENTQVIQGLRITSQRSQSCMKGRTPDMMDLRSCQRAGSANILLPFPFSFLGRTYGGQNSDVFVGDSSFVSFGGSDGNFFSSFEAGISDLPSLLIGARQNELKTLSVASDPMGWRVRYEGWSNPSALLDNFPRLVDAFSCTSTSLVANITWELLFMFDGSLQLCTSSLMGNLDPFFDSFAIKERICSSLFSFTGHFCTNFFQNLSAISAVSDGRSSAFLHKFDLAPSTLYTITTGVRQCTTACDTSPLVNKGVKIESLVSSSCIRGPTPDMTVVARCQNNDAFSIRLPFPFHYLNQSYSGGDVFVGSSSIVTFGVSTSNSLRRLHPALLIGRRSGSNFGTSNALKRLLVGPDPLGWRVRFEGWDNFLSLYDTIECSRPANIVWELLFLYNSSMQLCTSSFMNNLDMALNPNAESGLWDGTSFVTKLSLDASSIYSISTGLLPCSLDLSLSTPVASVNGSSLTARFPVNLRISRYDSVVLVITLQGAGFFVAPNTSVSLRTLPASTRAAGNASISNSDSLNPVLTVSLRGIVNCSVLSFTLSSITTPHLPQSSRKNIRFSVFDLNQTIIFSSESGSLVEIVPNSIEIEAGQPVVQLMNNAVLSSTTLNISLISSLMNIPTAFAPSVLVITLVGAEWSVTSPAQGRVIAPSGGAFVSASIATSSSSFPVLTITLSGAFSISNSSALQLLLFNVTTVSVVQPAASSIRSAILNSAGSIIATGTKGRLGAVGASSMGASSPIVNVLPPLASASGVRMQVTLAPQPLYQQSVVLPARIIITLTGSQFACDGNTMVVFTSPFDAANGTLNIIRAAGICVLTIGIRSGTFLSGYPVSFGFGPCSTPRAQPRMKNISAAMIDGTGTTVAASSVGTLSEIVEDIGQPELLLTDTTLSVAFTPRVSIPANSFLIISLSGVGLVSDESLMLKFSRPVSGASGTASIVGFPYGSVVNISFSTQYVSGIAIAFTLSPVYGGCFSNDANVEVTLIDKIGNFLASTTTTTNFSATMTRPQVTVQQLINASVNGIVIVPEGTYAGKCNCNSRIDANVPTRKAGAQVEIIGTAGRSVIDCSGTGLRCLIVQNSAIRVVDIIFKGGSSPVFVSTSAIAAIRAVFDAENQTSKATSNEEPRFASSVGDLLQQDEHSQLHGAPMKDVGGRGDHHNHRLFAEEGQSAASSSSGIFNKESSRRLLQSGPAILMFNAAVDESGGCILMQASLHSISLSGVTLLRCSAIYGGGGYFDVSNFDAKNTTAVGNVARQGGGIFVRAQMSTEIEMCDFFNNTVAASAISRRPNASSPDSAWAAGGGAWLQRLTKMKKCTFERNLALAAKSAINGSGPHALGSAMYVLETSSGSTLYDLQFIRSVSLCAGAGCYSAGSVIIVVAGMDTLFQGLNFIECHVSAISTMFSSSSQVEASGSCISVIDASAGMLKIEKIHSTNCSALSSGLIYGGCLNVSKVNNAVISHISVLGFNSNATLVYSPPYSQSCGMGGIVLFSNLKNSVIVNVSVYDAKIQCMGKHEGAVLFIGEVENATISSIYAFSIMYSGISELKGGILYVHQIGDVIFSNISLLNSFFVGRKLDGPYICVIGKATETASGRVLVLRGGLVKNVHAHAENNPPVANYIPISSILFLPLLFKGSACPAVIIENAVFQDVSMTCAGDKCTNYGIFDIITEVRESAIRKVSGDLPSFYTSNVAFKNVQSRCRGTACSVRGACMALSVPDATLVNIQVKNASVSSDGRGSFAGGCLLFHLHSSPIKLLRIINVTSEDARVSTTGAFSTAIGGVITAMYGNIIIDKVIFRRSHISCSGEACQSIGGSVAFASSLAPSNKREDGEFSATMANSELSGGLVECSGVTCEATGGGIFAGISYRGPFDQTNPGGLIVFKGSAPLPLVAYFVDCSVTDNVIKSDSLKATLSGAGISILLAIAKITNSRITSNHIQSTLRSAFVGGAGIYVSGDGSSASVVSTIIKLNDAGIKSSGGAIFAGPGSALKCESSVIDFNRATKGAGLFVEAASANMLSSSLCNNSAMDNGGGIFCVSSLLLNATSAITLSNVTVFDNTLRNELPGAVGATIYVFGDVFVELRNDTRFSMNGNNQYPTTEVILSVSRQANISDSTAIFCKSGSVLSLAFTEVVNQKITLARPGEKEQFDSQCNPACLFTPEITPYTASDGFMASCVPCPRGTYSLTTSSNRTDKVSSKCQPCPFGATCNGGSSIGALKSHWGWKISERELTSRFVLLPPGYACEENCTSISPCGGNRAGILCGSCASNYSIAFFTTSCVPSVHCSPLKWLPLIFICIIFQFIFSIFIFQYSSESDMLQKRDRIHALSRCALEQVPLFQNLSGVEFDAVVSKMELVHFSAQSTILVQGQSTNYMYIIETGVLTVYLHDGTGNEIQLATVVAPNVVGEQSLINGTVCAASVRALVDSDLWKLDRSCLDSIADDDKVSFARAKKTQYAKPDNKKSNIKSRDAHDDMWHPLSVLMWFYQLAGIMLSVSSPLKYLDGSVAAFSIVSFFVNAKPSYQAISEVSTRTASSLDANSFQFCVSPSMSYSEMHLATLMYYVMWALLMALLVQQNVWKLVRTVIIRFTVGIAWVLDFASKCFNRSFANDTDSFAVELRQRALSRQGIEIEIRGPVILKWFVTCFSAVASLMMQGTACVRLTGLFDAADELRWIYDGRVACFSDSGELPGRWQIAAVIGVVFVLLAPAVLWRIMLGIQRLDKYLRSPFQETLLNAYSDPYFSHSCHWMVVMYYQRLIMMVTATFFVSSPFFQGYVMLCLCFVILAMDCLYRPYKSFFMQTLSCSSAFCLLAICGLLLRSQSLISAARSPNFNPSDPSVESVTASDELNIIIGLLIFLLAAPAFMAIALLPRARSVFRDAIAMLRESFCRIFAKYPSTIQSNPPEINGLLKPLNAAASIQSKSSSLTRRDLFEHRCDASAELADESAIQFNESSRFTDPSIVQSGDEDSCVARDAPVQKGIEASQTNPSDATVSAATQQPLSAASTINSSIKIIPLPCPSFVESDDEIDNVLLQVESRNKILSQSVHPNSFRSNSSIPPPPPRSRSSSRTKQALSSNLNTKNVNSTPKERGDLRDSLSSSLLSRHSVIYSLQRQISKSPSAPLTAVETQLAEHSMPSQFISNTMDSTGASYNRTSVRAAAMVDCTQTDALLRQQSPTSNRAESDVLLRSRTAFGESVPSRSRSRSRVVSGAMSSTGSVNYAPSVVATESQKNRADNCASSVTTSVSEGVRFNGPSTSTSRDYNAASEKSRKDASQANLSGQKILDRFADQFEEC